VTPDKRLERWKITFIKDNDQVNSFRGARLCEHGNRKSASQTVSDAVLPEQGCGTFQNSQD